MTPIRRATIAGLAAATLVAATLVSTHGATAMPRNASPPDRFCDLMRELDKSSLALFDAVGDTAGEAKYAAAMVQSAKLYLAKRADLETSVPEAIREELKVVLDAYKAYAAGNAKALGASAYVEANDKLDEWVEAHCGFLLIDPEG